MGDSEESARLEDDDELMDAEDGDERETEGIDERMEALMMSVLIYHPDFCVIRAYNLLRE